MNTHFTSPDLLIIHDLDLRGLTQDEPMDLHEVVRQRYERKSTVITANRSIEEWAPLFSDPLMASATMDRNPPPSRRREPSAADAR
ncbi:ATP-binding protein [Corallococcus sp. c25j21]|nr:ATP-binding protein [Corallococcus silvisoli]